MKICMVYSTPFPPEEGIGYYVYFLSRKLIEKGHDVVLITRGSLNKTKTEIIDGIKVIKAPFLQIYPFHVHIHGLFVNKILKSFESKIDIVHIHSPLSPPIKTPLPLLVTIHTPMLTDTRSIEIKSPRAMIEKIMGKYFSYPIELNLLTRANMITTVAHSVASELQEYGLNQNKIMVIGNGVDTQLFTPIKNKTNEKYILYTGRLAFRKGLFDFIECGKYLCQNYPDIFFIIPGKGMLLDQLQKKVKEIGLKERFKFVGYVKQEMLIQLYQNATIFVQPSHYEGLPTVLLEAMSCGLPVVATAISGNVDVIISGENGILIPSKSPKKMADAITMLLDDDVMRKKLGKNARKTIEENYSWEVITNKYLKCYESLVDNVVV